VKIKDKLTEKDISVILDALEEKCNNYYILSENALKKGNIEASVMHSTEASVFGRTKWMIEDWLEEETKTESKQINDDEGSFGV
jgi:hypothetical protein